MGVSQNSGTQPGPECFFIATAAVESQAHMLLLLEKKLEVGKIGILITPPPKIRNLLLSYGSNGVLISGAE